MAGKKRMLITEVQELDEEVDAKFITQILALVRIHKHKRQKEKRAEQK